MDTERQPQTNSAAPAMLPGLPSHDDLRGGASDKPTPNGPGNTATEVCFPPGNAALTRAVKKLAKERGEVVHADEARNAYGYRVYRYRCSPSLYEAAVASIDKRSAYVARYSTPTDALPDVLEALWLLNRHAKRLTKDSAERIYRLKDTVIRYLWDHGYCTRAFEARSPIEVDDCWWCDGTGEDDESIEGECGRCHGTGVRRLGGGPIGRFSSKWPGVHTPGTSPTPPTPPRSANLTNTRSWRRSSPRDVSASPTPRH